MERRRERQRERVRREENWFFHTEMVRKQNPYSQTGVGVRWGMGLQLLLHHPLLLAGLMLMLESRETVEKELLIHHLPKERAGEVAAGSGVTHLWAK